MADATLTGNPSQRYRLPEAQFLLDLSADLVVALLDLSADRVALLRDLSADRVVLRLDLSASLISNLTSPYDAKMDARISVVIVRFAPEDRHPL